MRHIAILLSLLVLLCLGAASTQPETKNAAFLKIVKALPAAMQVAKTDSYAGIIAKTRAAAAWLTKRCKGATITITGNAADTGVQPVREGVFITLSLTTTDLIDDVPTQVSVVLVMPPSAKESATAEIGKALTANGTIDNVTVGYDRQTGIYSYAVYLKPATYKEVKATKPWIQSTRPSPQSVTKNPQLIALLKAIPAEVRPVPSDSSSASDVKAVRATAWLDDTCIGHKITVTGVCSGGAPAGKVVAIDFVATETIDERSTPIYVTLLLPKKDQPLKGLMAMQGKTFVITGTVGHTTAVSHAERDGTRSLLYIFTLVHGRMTEVAAKKPSR